MDKPGFELSQVLNLYKEKNSSMVYLWANISTMSFNARLIRCSKQSRLHSEHSFSLSAFAHGVTKADYFFVVL